MPQTIDAHHHLWHFTPEEFDWLEGPLAPLRRDFLPADLVPTLASAQIDGAITVQARQTLEETRWLLHLAANTPEIKGVVAWAPLIDPNLEQILEEFTPSPALKGLRHVLQAEPDPQLHPPRRLQRRHPHPHSPPPPRLRHPHLRAPTPPDHPVRRPSPPPALRPRPHRQAPHRRRNPRTLGHPHPHPRPTPQRLLQTLRPGHRSHPQLDPRRSQPLPRNHRRSLHPYPPPRRLRLARPPPRLRLRRLVHPPPHLLRPLHPHRAGRHLRPNRHHRLPPLTQPQKPGAPSSQQQYRC